MDFNSKLSELQQLKGEQRQIISSIAENKETLRELRRTSKLLEQAQVIIQNVALLTQNEFSFQISNLVTLALQTVFDDAYEFQIEFIERRGKIECDMWFVRNGEKIHPIDASGGGAVDIACFALRVAMWKLSQPKTRSILILDEPLRNLSVDLQEKANKMIRLLSERMKLQIIMVSHVADSSEEANNIISVNIKNGATIIL